MQRREVTCRLPEESVNETGNITILEANKCDDGIRPPQRQECHNNACKGVWRVGEWSEVIRINPNNLIKIFFKL